MFMTEPIQPTHIIFWKLTIEEWAAIVNLIVVTVLAVINFFYLRSAQAQTSATIKMAEESKKQADAAMESLRLLRSQVEQTNAEELARVLTVLRSIQIDVQFWLETTSNLGILRPVIKLVPDSFPAIVYQAGRISPSLREKVKSLEEENLLIAESLIGRFIATAAGYRDIAMMKSSQHPLGEAQKLLIEITKAFEKVDAQN